MHSICFFREWTWRSYIILKYRCSHTHFHPNYTKIYTINLYIHYTIYTFQGGHSMSGEVWPRPYSWVTVLSGRVNSCFVRLKWPLTPECNQFISESTWRNLNKKMVRTYGMGGINRQMAGKQTLLPVWWRKIASISTYMYVHSHSETGVHTLTEIKQCINPHLLGRRRGCDGVSCKWLLFQSFLSWEKKSFTINNWYADWHHEEMTHCAVENPHPIKETNHKSLTQFFF